MALNEDKQQCRTIDTDNLIVLCEIFEDYKAFYEDLDKLTKSKMNMDLTKKIYNYIIKKCFFNNSKYDTFIENHNQTIEIMKKYNCLFDFIILSYDINGKRINDLPKDYFYQYIEKHKEDIETIKSIALKIKELGIEKITLGEHLDFTTKQYTLIDYALNSSYNCKFAFLENMEVIPTYLNNSIRYRTSLSSYCIYLELNHFYGSEDEISKYDRRIELNNLIFNPNKLPDEITRKSTFGIIKGLAEKKKENCKDIKDSVDISISTDELKTQFYLLHKKYQEIDKLKDNEELKNLLTQMQDIIAKLQTFEEDFTKQIIDNQPSINEEIIKKEKSAELDRRRCARIDVD